MDETILFPTDGSDRAATVADRAIEIATTDDGPSHHRRSHRSTSPLERDRLHTV